MRRVEVRSATQDPAHSGTEVLARFVGFAVAGVPPEIMGIGPIAAIPKVLDRAGIKKEDLDWIELNEAFGAQALAVIKEAGLNPDIVNVNGGAIALGHPLGCTGAKLSVRDYLPEDMRVLLKNIREKHNS